MEINKLKLTGFKSFVEPSVLHIEPGLTGIVGPNGCGKSNLLEAIRWVMGENSPKNMRSGRSGGMEDVIFAGTSARPQRAFAEVMLHALDDEGEELTVTRRIERGAGSAYRLNGMDVRAKDVALIFADAATGAHSPALVSQGKIAQVIAAKPAERRMMLEEAAGIAGLHVRRRDAENKLRQTERNLARLQDIMASLDGQIANLRRQAKQAERYTKLSEDIRVCEARLIYARWRDAASAAEAALAEAKTADEKVEQTQQATNAAQKHQRALVEKLAELREEQADRRDDASAHGHRMATLSSQLEAAEERLADLDRQKARLEEDRFEADRLTQDAAGALRKLEGELRSGEEHLNKDEEQRPRLARDLEREEAAARAAELTFAQATADNAGVEAEWRVAEAELAQAKNRLDRLEVEAKRIEQQRDELAKQSDPQADVAAANGELKRAQSELAAKRETLANAQSSKEKLTLARDEAASKLATAKAERAGVEREWQALKRDRDARERQKKNRNALPIALDHLSAKPGYERALAAVLGRDGKSPLGKPEQETDGRFWTGAGSSTLPTRVSQSLAQYLDSCPEQLKARLALVHVVERDDGRSLNQGEWLVTKAGFLRRWDGFIARGEGGAEAARLEADNRFTQLDAQMPALIEAEDDADSTQLSSQQNLSALQRELVGFERTIGEADSAEREALRKLDMAEGQRERSVARAKELSAGLSEIEARRAETKNEQHLAQEKHASLPDPKQGRQAMEAMREQNDAARKQLQSASASLAAHDQALAVARERVSAQRAAIKNWQARTGDAAKRLAGMAARFEEIEQEHAVYSAKPEGLMREIEGGETVRERIGKELAKAEAAVNAAEIAARSADNTLNEANEALSKARETRAGANARAENEDARRAEMARISGERFQCPPPVLAKSFEFDIEEIRDAALENTEMERLTASRERIGPVNLVATEELARIEEEHGGNADQQDELAEAVSRLRGSIGSLNREGRERLRAAFEAVNEHFKRLFARLFEGGQAHLALVDSDDPLEAGLEIFAQPPGKRLQSLSLLSGGEQALTATALIFGLFLTNPAPICVLDEVDAPLDDANIDRFCDLLDSMVRETKTRYLIVTHNAVTMSRMHRLFGVTMVERGISRLVSVDLGQAELIVGNE